MITLPPKASAKVARMRAAINDAHALLASLTESAKLAAGKVHNARHNLTAADPKNAAAYARLVKAAESAEAERVAIERDRMARQGALADAERVLFPLSQWLETISYGPVGADNWDDFECDLREVMQPGEDHAAAVERVRHAIFNCASEIAGIKAAPVPVADARKMIDAEIARMAQLGTPRIEIVQPYGGVRVAWPGDRNRHEEMNLAPWTMLCWLQPEILREFLYSVAHATIGDRGFPPAAERPASARSNRKSGGSNTSRRRSSATPRPPAS